jgi:hypothetical protein
MKSAKIEDTEQEEKKKPKTKKKWASLWLLICLPEETEAWGFPEKSSRMECTKLYVFAELEPMAIHPQVPDTMEG